MARTSQQGPWPPRGYRSRDSSACPVSQGGTHRVLVEHVLGLALWGDPSPWWWAPQREQGPLKDSGAEWSFLLGGSWLPCWRTQPG